MALMSYDPEVTVAEDLYRRDTTMNSMAIELPSQNLCDPYGGAVDVQQQQIQAVSAHFCEVRSVPLGQRVRRQSLVLILRMKPMTICGPAGRNYRQSPQSGCCRN